MKLRPSRFSAMLRSELARLLTTQVKDPALHSEGLLTLTDVAVSEDLRHATVRVSFFDAGDRTVQKILPALEHARAYLEYQLMKQLELKHRVELRFVEDHGALHAAHINELLKG